MVKKRIWVCYKMDEPRCVDVLVGGGATEDQGARGGSWLGAGTSRGGHSVVRGGGWAAGSRASPRHPGLWPQDVPELGRKRLNLRLADLVFSLCQ